MGLAHLSIGTATNRLDLLDRHTFWAGDWEPTAGDTEESVATSDLSDYERLQYYREICVDEEIDLTIWGPDQNGAIRRTQDMRRMLRSAMDYWVENWREDPVYIAAQADCETNRRYCIVHRGKLPKDLSPYLQPFLQPGGTSVMVVPLVLRRGPWCDTAPGIPTCIEACAPDAYACRPSYLSFDGSGDEVDCHSDASIDDLPSAGFAFEAWVKADTFSGGNFSIADKGSWGLYCTDVALSGLVGYVTHNVQAAISASGTDEFPADGEWHHVAMVFDPTLTNNYVDLYIDGVEVSSYPTRVQANGAYTADAANDLYLGSNGVGQYWDGDIGWTRLLSAPVYRRNFTPHPRCSIPGLWYTAAGTQVTEGIWIYEGTGATTGNRAGNALTAGDITGATWVCDCTRNPGRLCDEEDMCWPCYLDFDGVADSGKGRIDGAGDLDNMVDDGLDFTAEVWIRADGYGANNRGQIFNKQADPNYGFNQPGWFLDLNTGQGLYFYVYGATAVGYASSGLDEFTPDGEWHHIVAAKDSVSATNANLYLAIDGVWVTSYASYWQKQGAYGSDAADPLIIGNRDDYARTFDGDIAWFRFSNNLRYTPGTDFTPPARCTIPDGDANTYGIYIYEGFGTQIYDWSGNCDPGFLQGAVEWGCDCTIEAEYLTSCESPAWIANGLKTSGITDVYHYYDDAAGNDFWSANLLDMPLPYALLPPTLVLGADGVGPILYFGVADDLANSGPFNNIVFDLLQAQTGLTGQWEFYCDLGGVDAFRLLSTYNMGPQDNTDADGLMTGNPLDTAGVKSVHWTQEPTTAGPPFISWQEEFLDIAAPGVGAPPIKAYWVRLKITAIAAGATFPIQQNRHPYTIAWPYFEVQEDEIPGDIAASLAMELFNEADHDGGIYDPLAQTSRLICGLRSLSRGEDFVAYLNAADEQNPAFITCSLEDAGWTFTDSINSMTGRIVQRTIPIATTTNACQWTIDSDYTAQFYGEYRAFVRARASGANDISVQLELTYGYGRGSSAVSEWIDAQWSTSIELFDMGRFVIPPTDWIKPSENSELGILVRAKNNDTVATHLMEIFDVILIPVDEWAGDFTGAPVSWSDFLSGNRSMTVDDWGGLGRYAYVDSITNPRYDLRVLSLLRDTGNFTGLADVVANRPAILRENNGQRMWFLAERHIGPIADREANIEIAHSIQVYRQSHYLSMRGNR